jgi:hypothetical protein
MRRRLSVTICLVLLCGCQKPPREVPGTPPSLTGTITRIESQGRNSGQILVEENPDETSGSDKARIKISPATHIVRRSGHIAITAGDLRPGQRVSVWYSGPVLESYPVQASALVILLQDVPARPSSPPPKTSPPIPPKNPPENGNEPPGETTSTPEEEPPPVATTDGSDWTAGIVDRAGRARGVAVLRAVREASHAEFDRVVFEFDGGGVPHAHIEYVDRPVTQCGSGETVPVAGDAWLEVRFDPAQAHDDAGRATVASRNRHPGFPVVEQIVLTCDFEGHVTWVLGVSTPHRFLVRELSDPARLVIDIRH